MLEFTERERQVLQRIQGDFPLVPRPYHAIAGSIGRTEHEVIETLRELKARQIIRQISAIFQGAALGFTTALVSFHVPDERLEQVAQVINAHPGVSHNYQRAHRFNLWFTLSVPSPLDITRHVRALARLTACSDVLYLPSVKMFKRRVRFALDDTQTPLSSEKKSVAPPLDTAAGALSASLSPEVQRQLMQALQQDLPLTPAPFKALADRFQVSDEVFFAFLHYLQASHKMSRFSGIVRHRKLGFTANAMVVWQIPAAQAPGFVEAATAYEAVSHCYERVTYPHWPYNLYTMVHGTSRNVTEQVIAALAAQGAAEGYEVLYSTREFKKQRVDYFSGAIDAWDAVYVRNGGKAA